MNHRKITDHAALAPDSLARSQLVQCCSSLEIKAIDVGARGELDQLLRPISPLISFIGFDADPEEVRRLNSMEDNEWGHGARYLPIALGGQPGSRTLYVTRSPGCSSLLQSDPVLYRKYGREHLFAIESEFHVETSTLDQSAQEHQFISARYLKIDVQGAEFEILKSATQLLSNSLTAVRTEVEFKKIYKNQPLFRDLDAFLDAQGFLLAGFYGEQHWSRSVAGLEAFGKGQECLGEVAHGDAIYLKRIECLPCSNDAEIRKAIEAGFLGLSLGRVSYAADILMINEVREYLRDEFSLNSREAINEIRGIFRNWRSRLTRHRQRSIAKKFLLDTLLFRS